MKKRYLINFIIILIMLAGIAVFAAGQKGNKGNSLNKTMLKSGDSYRLFINNIDMPLNSHGVMADVAIGSAIAGGKIDEKVFLYSGGFFMSGITNGTQWANAVASASRTEDYEPGNYDSGSRDSRAQLYVVKQNDGEFAQSWIDWKDAVALGAEFYDGDNDGIYNPVDKNNNGKWDTDEDRPDLIGDETAWCVYSDSKSPTLRTFNDVDPQGIEIRQTVFAFSSKSVTGNMLFLRYNILNTGSVADVIDSVYFGVWADPDLGDPNDDLVGCDTLLDAGFIYNNGDDQVFGAAPPSFIIDFFQGPVAYIPGVTYTDVNANGRYDENVDTPLDTAYNVRGKIRGVEQFPGAKNLGLSSFVHYQNNDPNLGDPANRFEARRYLQGRNRIGGLLDPCTWGLGTVDGGVECANINPKFWYSGDPVAHTGWINTTAADQRIMTNTGPFRLEKNVPVNIIVAYVIGKGTSALNSVTVAKNNDITAQKIFDNNFPSPPPPPPVKYSFATGEDFIDLSWNTSNSIQYNAVDTILDVNKRVQGFFVTEYKTSSPTSVINGQVNAAVIARYDLADSINDIYTIAVNGGKDLRIPEAPPENKLDSVLYADPETGRIVLRINTDPFTGSQLIKGHEYYFTISQYTLNHNVIVQKETNTYGPAGDYFDPSGSALDEYETPIIKVVMGEDLFAPAIKGADGEKISGASNGAVKYLVVNNDQLTGDEYSITFFKDRAAATTELYSPLWKLTRTSNGQVLIDSSKIYNFDTTSYAGKVVEGFITKIKPLTIELGNPQYTNDDKWFDDFSADNGTGVFYVGQDIPQASDVFISANSHSNIISADKLRRVELRFGTTGKAYRYLNGFTGANPILQRGSFTYAEGIAASDTVNKGTIGQLGAGYVNVPFTAWVIDEKYQEEKQLAVGFIEKRASYGGEPDGIWNPKDSLMKTGEVIVIFDTGYDPGGSQVEYKGNSSQWADLIKGFDLTAPGASTDQVNIAKSPWFNAMYVVGLQGNNAQSTFTPGDKLIMPIETYPYTAADKFEFKTRPKGELPLEDQKDIFSKVNVFPNPLYGYNSQTSYESGKRPDEPFVTFSNLPEEVTISIYSLSGSKIRTLGTSDKSNPTSPFIKWNLQNESGLRVASGMYLALVSAPGYGEKILKFAIIMPQKQIQNY